MPDSVLTLSQFEVKPLLEARRRGLRELAASGDLGLTSARVELGDDGVRFGDGGLLPWAQAERIHDEPNKCFAVTRHGIDEIRVFSPDTGWVRSLWPTGSAPTTVVAGFSMHRIQGVDPLEDTRRKVQGAGPMRGAVLDTATGLGYTAILAARSAASVVTIELDPAAIELARRNPWSSELFSRTNITQRIGDVTELVADFADDSFAQVIHDPPTLKLAGEMYSAAFYRQLRRVLRPNGRLSHYIGDPDSMSGKRTTRGVVERLRAAGFSRVDKNPLAFGVVATK